MRFVRLHFPALIGIAAVLLFILVPQLSVNQPLWANAAVAALIVGVGTVAGAIALFLGNFLRRAALGADGERRYEERMLSFRFPWERGKKSDSREG